jgi:translation initiation factor 4A
LLTMLGRRASLPVAVCCSSRDSLDAVWSTVSASQEFSLSVLHSDQAQSERVAALDNFRQVVADWTHGSCEGNALPSGSNCVDDRQQRQSGLLMTTDACLPSAALGEAPLGARVLIHYDLPAKKVNLLLLLHFIV